MELVVVALRHVPARHNVVAVVVPTATIALRSYDGALLPAPTAVVVLLTAAVVAVVFDRTAARGLFAVVTATIVKEEHNYTSLSFM